MKRLLYDKLVEWKSKLGRKPLILRGVRQCGKTWLLKEFGKNEFRKIHYVNFEKSEKYRNLFSSGYNCRDIVNSISIIEQEDFILQEDLLVFDEIQECPEAITSLKYFCEEMNELALCCAGSLIGISFSGYSFPVGKIDILNMYPMNFEEFLMADNPQAASVLQKFDRNTVVSEPVHQLLWDELKIYFMTGGMPEAISAYLQNKGNLLDALNKTRDIQNLLVLGYRSDFSKHAGKENAAHINRIFDNVPEQIRKNIDGGVSRYRFKGVIPNKSKYSQFQGPIDWLLNAGLGIKCSIVETPSLPLKSNARQGIMKIYMFDIGILGAMNDLSFESILNQDYGAYKGYYAENFVAQELVASGIADLFSWEGRESQIEFLKIINGKVIPIEVKSGKTVHSRSLSAFSDKYSPELKIKLTARNLDRSYPGCHNYPLYLSGKL